MSERIQFKITSMVWAQNTGNDQGRQLDSISPPRLRRNESVKLSSPSRMILTIRSS